MWTEILVKYAVTLCNAPLSSSNVGVSTVSRDAKCAYDCDGEAWCVVNRANDDWVFWMTVWAVEGAKMVLEATMVEKEYREL